MIKIAILTISTFAFATQIIYSLISDYLSANPVYDTPQFACYMFIAIALFNLSFFIKKIVEYDYDSEKLSYTVNFRELN